MGHLSLVFKLKIENFEDQIYEDVREIEKYYFDPFTSSDHEIAKVTWSYYIVESGENIRYGETKAWNNEWKNAVTR